MKSRYPLQKILGGFGLVAVLSLYPKTTLAADNSLIFIGKDSENYKYYLDKDWLKAEDNGLIDFVYTVRLPEPDANGVLFIDGQAKGHCATSRMGLVSVQLYNVNDRLMGEKRLDALDFDIVQPGSMNQLVLDAACRILKTAN